MTAAPIHDPAAPLPYASAPGPRMVQRAALALTLWLTWCTPLLIMGLTASRFVEIFKEFGVRLSAAAKVAIGAGQLAASPLGIGFALTVLPVLAVALSFLLLPPRPPAAAPSRPRWSLVAMALVASTAGAFGVWLCYSLVLAQTMAAVAQRLQ